MGECVVVTSGKGGVGKTTVCAYLGRAFAERGRRVCLIDADLNMSNLDVAMRQEQMVIHGLEEVLNGQCRLSAALLPDPTNPNLTGLYVKSPAPFHENAFPSLCEELKRVYDLLLIDCPAGVESGFRRAVTAADKAILVTTPQVSAVRDADRTVQALSALNRPVLGIILNRVVGKKIARGEMMPPREIGALLRLNLVGVIPEDETLSTGETWCDPTRIAFHLAAKRLSGETAIVYDPVKRERNPFYLSSLRRLLYERA